MFDLIHYGHLKHLQKAKQVCDILIVSITSSLYVNKGPNRPFYNDEIRKEFLSTLPFVDYIYISQEKNWRENY